MTDDFVDKDAINAVLTRAVDALRPLGLTIQPEMVQVTLIGDDMLVVLPCLLRPDAKKKLDTDKDARAEFNKMMAERNEALIKEKKSEIISSLDNLEDVLFGGAQSCKHLHVHPDGFCIDCGEPVETDEDE